LLQAFSPLGSPGVNGPSVLNNPIVISVAEKLQKTPAQVALRWGIQMGQSVLPKSANEARIKENIDIFDWSIPEDLMAKFSEIKQACSSLAFSLLFAFHWLLVYDCCKGSCSKTICMLQPNALVFYCIQI
jgi:diketogulonate reductase-like aldo/keto reductase